MFSYNNLTDKELIELLVCGDQKAFAELYNRYWQRMLIKAFDRLASHVDAEEVVQDAFANLWNRRQKLEIKYSFHTYIASIIRYEVMARLASKKQFIALSEVEDNKPFLIADNTTEQWLDYEELRAQIEENVGHLPKKCRLVFKLSREEGFSLKQIASHLEISQKTVEAHVSKALRLLRQSLNQFFILLIILVDL